MLQDSFLRSTCKATPVLPLGPVSRCQSWCSPGAELLGHRTLSLPASSLTVTPNPTDTCSRSLCWSDPGTQDDALGTPIRAVLSNWLKQLESVQVLAELPDPCDPFPRVCLGVFHGHQMEQGSWAQGGGSKGTTMSPCLTRKLSGSGRRRTGSRGRQKEGGEREEERVTPSQALCCPLGKGAEHRTTEVN